MPPASPASGSSVNPYPLQLVIPSVSPLVLFREQGDCRGVGLNPIALSENFGFTSTSLTESSLLVLLEQSCLNSCHSCVDWPHLLAPQPPFAVFRLLGGSAKLKVHWNRVSICTTRVCLSYIYFGNALLSLRHSLPPPACPVLGFRTLKEGR